MSLEHLAKYPFLPGAKKYVEDLGMPLDKMLAHPVYSAALEAGRSRVEKLFEKKFSLNLPDKLGMELAILSYPLARLIAHGAGSEPFLREYLSAEGRYNHSLLQKENDKTVRKMAVELGLRYEDGRLHFMDYLKYAADLSTNPRWNLVNQEVVDGWVNVDDDMMRRIISEHVKKRLGEKIDPKAVPKQLVKIGKQIAATHGRTYEQISVSELEDRALPPCIKHIIMLVEGNSANHQAMFTLATFLINLGLGRQGILNVFKKSPKYDEELASYQIEFLSGEKSGTKYTCPTCATIKSQGQCVAECSVKHPLQYYRNNASNIKQSRKKG